LTDRPRSDTPVEPAAKPLPKAAGIEPELSADRLRMASAIVVMPWAFSCLGGLHGDRRRRRGVGAAQQRTGDDDGFDFVVGSGRGRLGGVLCVRGEGGEGGDPGHHRRREQAPAGDLQFHVGPSGRSALGLVGRLACRPVSFRFPGRPPARLAWDRSRKRRPSIEDGVM
jgi:hypothetical protein